MQVLHLNAVVILAIYFIILATNHITYSCCSHQIALVRAVYKLLSVNLVQRLALDLLKEDRLYRRTLLLRTDNAIVIEHLHSTTLNVPLEDSLRHLGLKNPALKSAVVSTRTAIEIE